MGVKIHLKPTEVWPFFDKNFDRLKKEMVAIAENEETGHSVYLTESNGCPLLSVYREDNQLYVEGAVSAKDCEDTAKRMYLKYLFPVVVTDPKPNIIPEQEDKDDEISNEELELQALEDAIYEREDELLLATTDFLEVLLNCNGPEQISAMYGKHIAEDFLESACEMLARDHMISVYRPTWVTDEETGAEEYVEFPYEDEIDEGNAAGKS